MKTTATTLERAAKALGVRSLDSVGSPMATISRNEVLRARTPDGGTVIVKGYLVPEPVAEGREPSALFAGSGWMGPDTSGWGVESVVTGILRTRSTVVGRPHAIEVEHAAE